MLQVGGVRLKPVASWKSGDVEDMCATSAGRIGVRLLRKTQLCDRKRKTLTTYTNLCNKHEGYYKHFVELIAGQYLADLCEGCNEIVVIDMNTGRGRQSAIEVGCLLGTMCAGPGEGSLLVWDKRGQTVIQLQWDESRKLLQETRRLQVRGEWVDCMCYVTQADLIVLSCGWKVVKAVALQGGGQRRVWQVQGEVLGKRINPWGVSSDSEGRVYIPDGHNRRVLVVNGYTGEVIQELLQDAGLGDVWRVCCLSNPSQLLVHHTKALSLYSITYL